MNMQFKQHLNHLCTRILETVAARNRVQYGSYISQLLGFLHCAACFGIMDRSLYYYLMRYEI